MYRERKTWSSRKFGERIFFGEDDVFQMKEFRTTLIYIHRFSYHVNQLFNAIVVISNILYFHPYLGKIPNLTNIFQMGWNHQLDKYMFKSSTYTPKD